MSHFEGLKTGILSWKKAIVYSAILAVIFILILFEETKTPKKTESLRPTKPGISRYSLNSIWELTQKGAHEETYPDEIYFGPYECQKEIVLDTKFETPWIKIVDGMNWRVEVIPDSGYHIRFIDGTYFNVKPKETIWFGVKKGRLKLRAKEKGQKAVISIENQ